MKTIARCILLLLSICIISSNAFADGKFFYRERVPADIPYQRAFLIFHENTETLILQSKYEISKSQAIDSLGWVVPVPSEPDITSMDADDAHSYFHLASNRTQPKTFSISNLLNIIVFIMFGCSFLLSIVLHVIFIPELNKIGRVSEKLTKTSKFSFYVFVISFVYLFSSGVFTPALSRQSKGGDVEIIKAQKAGIYDVKVIKSEDTNAIIEWLNENNFNFDANDSEVFADYISRDWCFVVANVQPEPEARRNEISAEGMAAPLILKFATEKAIYPTALTAAIGTETQILLYTLSDNKLDCNDRLKLRAAQKVYSVWFSPVIWANLNQETKELLTNTFETIPSKMFLCKFKSALTSEQMKEDIVLEKASNNETYRETRIAWKR